MVFKTLRSVRFFSPIIAAIGIVFIIGQEYVRPWMVLKLNADEYKALAFNCDMAMHEEAAIRQYDKCSTEDKALRLSADVGMMVCHDYDKFRKKMLISGVSEDHLAMLGIEVLEIEKITVKQMVDAHRMDRF